MLEAGPFCPPAPVPRIEHLRPLALLRTLWSNPIEAWTREHFERAIVISHMPFAEVVVVSDPVAIRRVLVDNRDNYHKDPFQKRMLTVLRNGLLTAEGDQWLSQRRALTPLFTARIVRSFVPMMLETIRGLIERWRSRDGEVIDVAYELTELALAVLERTIFSDGMAEKVPALKGAMRIYFDSLGRIDPFDVLNLPDFVPRLARLRARPALKLFHRTVDEMIVMRQRTLDGRSALRPHDLLTLMLQARDPESGRALDRAEIKANVITFMAAGHESTANAITWALFLLSRSSIWYERVVAEAARELDDPNETLLDRLVDTRAVVEESLRLYPPLAAMSRIAIESDELAGQPIRRGAIIVVAPYVLHRHRLWWKEPDLFDPKRFSRRAREAVDRYAYIPFGAGPRGCIGSLFAIQEATLAVAAIAREFDLSVAPGHEVWPVHRITLRPRNGLPMVARWRGKDVRFGSRDN